jgi:hypothetical protein
MGQASGLMKTFENHTGLRATRTLSEWNPDGRVPPGFEIRAVVVGRDDAQLALEVVVLKASQTTNPSREALGWFHTARLGRRLSPVVVLASRSGQAWMFGPNAQAAVVGPLPEDQALRMMQSALDEPSGLAARQRLAGMYAAIDATKLGTEADYLPGVSNNGLFATHELRNGVRQRSDWSSACEAARPLLSLRREALVEALGYTAQSVAAHALILLADGVASRAVAVLLDESESFDGDSSRFSVSPVAYAVSIAQKHELPWVIILRGSQLRLYSARAELGVGRKGLAETYFEIDLSLVTDESVGFLSLLFSAPALSGMGSTAEILAASAQYAVALGDRLRSQVYEQIVPKLSLAIAPQLPALGHPLDRHGLDLAYQLTLSVFFRLLFQAYAEDRKLLPFGDNPRYDRNALNTLARDLAENPDEVFDENSASIWDDLAQVWHVIDKGDTAWSVPAYNGGLFGCDPELQPEGELLERIRVTNDVMGPVLRAMLIDTADGVAGPIDFRSLSVREFGTIYEGLLESNLAVAETDLVLDDKDTWIPAKPGTSVDPERSALGGSVYFHNTSGQRKGTGSYFTPSFVVEHLLERALDPTLAEHLVRVKEKLDAGDQVGAADLFFDFRVADLAMGSGHFLTAAIDHLEAGMAAFLAENPIPGVTNELRYLEEAARDAAGPDFPEPEPSSLLRRQIARRCIYGLDINPVAVELARVSIWIHTFVRGLPMSSLDHNLVCANSLTGVGTVDEALDALVPGRNAAPTLFDASIEQALKRARSVLVDVANAAEATRKEAQEAARASLRAHAEAGNATLLFDAAVLRRIGDEALVAGIEADQIAGLAATAEAQEAIAPLVPAHLPALFPEVFLRDRSGFDVLIGNPPWEKIKVEEHQWWGLRYPGLRGMPMHERTARLTLLKRERPDLFTEYLHEVSSSDAMRKIIAAGPYPGIGSGDIDLYKAFAWRNWQLTRDGGQFGVVLPRGALNGSGTQLWRRQILERGAFTDAVVTVNTGNWVFDNVDGRYTTALVVVTRGTTDHTVSFAGPFHSRDEFEDGRDAQFVVSASEFDSWTATAAFPLIPDPEAGDVFRQMRRHPPLGEAGSFEFRPYGELHAAQNRDLFDTDASGRRGTVPVLTGSSFNLWNPDSGAPYGWADAEAEAYIFAKTLNSAGQARSVFHDLGITTAGDLPMHHARIAFRDVCRSNDSRTAIVCLLPPEIVLVHKAPFLVRRKGDERDEAYLLGVMSSVPFDWYARRLVELAMTFEVLTPMPVPRPQASDERRTRVIEVAGRLASRDERFSIWADAVGVPVNSVDTPDEQAALEAELDALVAHLYGLSRDQLGHVFATFHRGWDYAPRLGSVLGYFDALGELE